MVGRNVRMISLQNNEGMTPLHLACSNGHDQVAEYLLSQGATIEKYDFCFCFFLHMQNSILSTFKAPLERTDYELHSKVLRFAISYKFGSVLESQAFDPVRHKDR